MATLVRDVERPAFLDRPAEGQLSFGAVATPPREARGRTGRSLSLSERLNAERALAAAAAVAAGEQAVRPRSGGATLDELLVGAWEGLSARRSVACPVCRATMLPRTGAAGGACAGCGSQLR